MEAQLLLADWACFKTLQFLDVDLQHFSSDGLLILRPGVLVTHQDPSIYSWILYLRLLRRARLKWHPLTPKKLIHTCCVIYMPMWRIQLFKEFLHPYSLDFDEEQDEDGTRDEMVMTMTILD